MAIPRYVDNIKIIGLLAVLSSFMCSCKEISFHEPQPAGVAALKEVPDALRGRYTGIDDQENDTADTLVIEAWGYHFKGGKDNDWLGRGVISDSLVLKFYENYWFVNFRSGDQWVLRVIRKKSGKTIEFMSMNISDDAKRKDILKKLSKRFPVKEVQQKSDTFYEIAPSKEQLLKLIKEGFFSGNDLSKIK